MSEYFFGLGRGKVPVKLRNKIDNLASKHDAYFVNPNLPGEGYRYWFTTANLGHPFDQATERAVYEELKQNGIKWPLKWD